MMVVPNVKLLLLCSLLFWKACECAPLETTIDGRSGSTSCVGDTVTYTCTIADTAHRWRIPSLGLDETITRATTTFNDSQFTIVTTADGGGGNPIITELTVNSSAALNGATITCSDPNLGTMEVQETTVMVFGSPLAPGLTVEAGEDVASYNFTIIPSSPSDCVLDYIITAISSDANETITVPASGVDGSTPVNEAGFDVCTVMYSFTVAPVTSEGTGPSSASVDRGPSKVASITGLRATLSSLVWCAPSNVPMTCFPQYIISLTDNPAVNLTVTSTQFKPRASSVDLNATGFPYCVDQSVTVTPILVSTGAPLTTSSAEALVTINIPGILVFPPNVLNFHWEMLTIRVSVRDMVDMVVDGSVVIVGIGRSLPNERDCMAVQNVAGEYVVPLDCSYNGTSVTICVRFTIGDCSYTAIYKFRRVTLGEEVCPLPTATPASIVGPVVGGVVGGVAAVAVVIIIIILIMVLYKKKGKGSGGDGVEKAEQTRFPDRK